MAFTLLHCDCPHKTCRYTAFALSDAAARDAVTDHLVLHRTRRRYVFGGCFACREAFDGVEPIYWLEDGNETAYPFHRLCSKQPWPLSACPPPPEGPSLA